MHYDAIMVVVCRLSKQAHFIPTHTTISAIDTAKLFFKEIFCLHGMPKTLISDRDVRFTSKFWTSLFKLMNVGLNMNIAFHPQIDGQTERINRILEECLRSFVSFNQVNWVECLFAAEFAYNNFFHTSINASPFQLVYGKNLLTPQQFHSNLSAKNPAAHDFLTNWKTKVDSAIFAL
jgi:hypothetical protein